MKPESKLPSIKAVPVDEFIAVIGLRDRLSAIEELVVKMAELGMPNSEIERLSDGTVNRYKEVLDSNSSSYVTVTRPTLP